MFVVEITAVLVTIIAIANVTGIQPVTGPAGLGFQVQIARMAVVHRPLRHVCRGDRRGAWPSPGGHAAPDAVGDDGPPATRRRYARGRRFRPSCARATSSSSREGETIPGDGDVIEGVAYVNEAAITGESAPVLKEPGTDIRSSVTGGTQVTSDTLVIVITADPGETFLDRMIALVEGAKRQRTPNEIALSILLAGLTPRLPDGDRHPPAVRPVRRRDGRHRRSRRAARLPHPDDDRRSAVRDRHRRDGPRRAVQRAGDERPRRGGLGRRRRHPARQDRHDHVRQPPRVAHRRRCRVSPRPRS